MLAMLEKQLHRSSEISFSKAPHSAQTPTANAHSKPIIAPDTHHIEAHS
jgi:hypothetical protein